MRAIIVAAVAAALYLSKGLAPAAAADASGDFTSYGMTCGEYLRSLGKSAAARTPPAEVTTPAPEVVAYVLGFVTGYNSYARNGRKDVLGVLEHQRGILYDAMAEVCKEVPDEPLGYALGRFLEEWDHDQ